MLFIVSFARPARYLRRVPRRSHGRVGHRCFERLLISSQLHPHVAQKLSCVLGQRRTRSQYENTDEHHIRIDRLDGQAAHDEVKRNNRVGDPETHAG